MKNVNENEVLEDELLVDVDDGKMMMKVPSSWRYLDR